jgi:hypothetical protein
VLTKNKVVNKDELVFLNFFNAWRTINSEHIPKASTAEERETMALIAH